MNSEQIQLHPENIALSLAQEFFDSHVREVKRIAHSFVKKPFAKQVHELDLVNAGLLGLIEAINRYNPQNSAKFTPFARIRIRGAMLDEIRREDSFTRTDRKWLKKIEQASRHLQASLGREPNEIELSEELGIKKEHLESIRQRLSSSEESLEAIEDEQIIGLRVTEVFSFEEDPLRQLLFQENSKLISKALEDLKPSERLTIRLSFYENLPLTRIAELLGLTLSRVSQIRTEALKKMRVVLRKFN